MDKRSRYYRRKKKRKARRRALLLCLSTAVIGIVSILAVVAMIRQHGPLEAKADAGVASGSTGKVQADSTELLTAPSQESPAPDLSALKITRKNPQTPLIAIDPGYGGSETGSVAADVMEKDVNLKIGLLLEQRLTDMGYEVLMLRQDDSNITEEKRIQTANVNQADIYVGIRQKTYDDSAIRGTKAWYSKEKGAGESNRLARLLYREAIKTTASPQLGVFDNAKYASAKETSMPSCVIETGVLTNADERQLLVQEEYQNRLAEGLAKAIDIYFHPKVMYLTFDDGPSAENTTAVLDILKSRNIKATFFVVGKNVRKHPEVAKRIVADGHTIGIHCNDHNYAKLYESVDSYLQDFDEAYQAVLDVTGVKVKLFRFPGGSINAYNKAIYPEITEKMTERGFIYFDWNASLEDAVKRSDPSELIANATSTTLGRNEVILLAHDIVHSTALCLDELLDQFPEYTMEPLTTEVEPIHMRIK